MPSIAAIGAQYGDEGKGKVVDFLAADSDFVVRFAGGNNAGHTVVANGKTYKFHLVPSGIVAGKICCIGAGVSIDPAVLFEELEQVNGKDANLLIDYRAQVIMPYHKSRDCAMETSRGKAKIGTTGRGIGPSYADRALRTGFRIADIIDPAIFEKKLECALSMEEGCSMKEIFAQYSDFGKRLKKFAADVSMELHKALASGKTVLFEGAQGTFLDTDFGTYPYVTSSHPISGGIFAGVGIAPQKIGRIIGVAKAYTTRVGEGPFTTELEGEMAERIRKKGGEYGTTTGRPRRTGWLDLVLLRTAARINGFTEIALTKLDVISGIGKLKVCTEYELAGKKINEFPADSNLVAKCKPIYKELAGFEISQGVKKYEDLPAAAKDYISFIEKEIKVPVKIVSYGADRKQTIVR